MKKHKKAFLWLTTGVATAVLLLIIGCYYAVVWNASGKTYESIEDMPHNKVGLLLATSPITSSGAHNYYFDNRIQAADELYKAGKVDFIIASGGDYIQTQKNGCNEPKAILDSLVARGVPVDRIILDYEGTRTLNSIVKAKEAYGLDSLTLISQKYHNERAIYLAEKYGIYAIGYNAQPSPIRRNRIKNMLREYLARIKMFIDLLIDRKLDITTEANDSTDLFNLKVSIEQYGNSVKGHVEKDTIVGNFTGNDIDTLYVAVKFNEKAGVEERVKYYAKSNNPALPTIELYGCLELQPKLVYEGDVDGDGKDEWGYLHTWLNSQWRYYRIYNYNNSRKEWTFLYYDAGCDGQSLLNTPEYVRSSGVDIVEKGPSPGLIKINYSSSGMKCELQDTVVRPTYTRISKDAW